ncbi:cytochrome b/b6 domain-containing protein [Sulfurimonas lithotrophica]|uniref:Cytochrome b/b6 domain-containing protein n=1 Tax=Sulfurimonas lithotrophica TaxID=2590022 RepID=A0A5P8NZC9_9BACT|nr:cytochrome b/b6 domain-containing protein [Sulfurimonas lithotrophica]QFR48805.1 cytochrome b/b6 domain-containing protein [Sulfurimonas lithotrophica]
MKYSISFRIWHWLNAIVVLGLLGTVFLRKTFLSWRTNSEILMDKLFDMDIEITLEQAKILAKAIRAGMWEWHIILGYALVFLIVYRIVLYFKDSSIRESFSSLTPHKKAVHILYYIIYATLIFMSISGFMIHFYQDLGLSKEAAHDIKEIHEFVFNIIMYFVPIHIAGVIIADNTEEKGLVSSMINGKEC